MKLPASMIAIVCHEANRAYCACIGDTSQKVWAEAEQWQKDSATRGVQALLNDPSLSPQELHKRWWAEKIGEGWSYGKVKDAEKKTHPCMVAYEELPEDQQRKDYLFHAVVKALAGLPPGFVHA